MTDRDLACTGARQNTWWPRVADNCVCPSRRVTADLDCYLQHLRKLCCNVAVAGTALPTARLAALVSSW